MSEAFTSSLRIYEEPEDTSSFRDLPVSEQAFFNSVRRSLLDGMLPRFRKMGYHFEIEHPNIQPRKNGKSKRVSVTCVIHNEDDNDARDVVTVSGDLETLPSPFQKIFSRLEDALYRWLAEHTPKHQPKEIIWKLRKATHSRSLHLIRPE